MDDDRYNALVSSLDIAGAEAGPLAGTTFVAKDVLDVIGTRTGAGNPAVRAAAIPAARSAEAVRRLLAAGSRLVGKARTDELAFSMAGRNELDGTPLNPAAPGRLTAGSSSGPAAAVAGQLADIGVGTDTGGSIRVPASHCGLVGLRPTHGRVSSEGVFPLAPSFDTVGWLTHSGHVAQLVGSVLLDEYFAESPAITDVLVLDDVVAVATEEVQAAVAAGVDTLGLAVSHVRVGAGDDLERWRDTLRVLQGAEAWATHGAWLRATDPPLSPSVRGRFEAASRVTAEEVAAAQPVRRALRARLTGMLDATTALVVPAAATEPLLADASADAVDAARFSTLLITCLASLTGLPSIAVPVAGRPLPAGIALIAAHNGDESLLCLVKNPP